MAIYAQIKNNIVQNCIVLTDTSLESLFSRGFDYFIEIDQLNPTPGLGWTYDGTNFNAPVVVTLPLNQQYTSSQYGQMLIDQFAQLNSQRGLTSVQLFTLAQTLQPYYILLQIGALQAFLDNIGNITVDGVLITMAIITEFQGAIQIYLEGG